MARMAAGTRKRADGTLEKRFTIKGKRYSVYGKSTKEIAEKEQAVRQAIKENSHVANINITINRYYEEWIERKRDSVKGYSLCTYKNCFKNHILPHLGKKKIRDLGRRDIIAFQSKIAETLSAKTSKYVVNILCIMLSDAVKDDIIVKNPAAGIPSIKSDRPKASETIHRALTVEEQAAFMDEMRNEYYYTFVAIMLSTGMRCGEVAGLQWNDIDHKNNVIHVRRTTTMTEDGKLQTGTTTKTPTGVRDIPITANVRTILAEQRKLSKILPMPCSAVFQTEYGKAVRSTIVNKAISRVLDRLDSKGVHIEHFSSHALRDTFATRYIEGGGNMQTLKTILGHTSLAMTADLYSHVLPNTKQEEMNSIHIAI